MGEQRLTWTGEGIRFEGEDSWGHRLEIGDGPGSPGAKPSDLLPISLAACTAYDVVSILRKQRQDLRALDVQIETEQDDRPPWTFRRITLRFAVTGDISEAKAERALALAEKECSVHATIRDAVEIRASIEVLPAG